MGSGNDRRKDAERLSRRHFLKYGGAAAVGGVASTLTGCGGGGSGRSSDSVAPDTSDSSDPITGGSIDYRVIETDVLCIGTGYGGSSAITAAMKGNRKITVLDKGPFRHSGATGMNWDVQCMWYRGLDPATSTEEQRETHMRQCFDHSNIMIDERQYYNTELQVKATTSDPNRNCIDYYAEQGEVFRWRHDEDSEQHKRGELYVLFGQQGVYCEPGGLSPTNLPYTVTEGGYPRHGQDYFAGSPLVTIHDKVMVTNAIIQDGVCLGVTAVHLPTGEYRVYKANAVIYNTGGACNIFGRANALRGKSINVPENTSDLDMGLFRQGIEIGDSEFCSYDIMNSEPRALAHSFNLGIGGDSVSWHLIVDSQGIVVCEYYPDGTRVPEEGPERDEHFLRIAMFRDYFNAVVCNYVLRNNERLYLDMTNAEDHVHMRHAYLRSVDLWREKFGFDVLEERIPIDWEMYEHGGNAIVDENLQVKGAEGLFCIRGAGTLGSAGGGSTFINIRLGSYATRCAKEYLDTNPVKPPIDFSIAEKEFQRLDGIRTKSDSNGGYRPNQVRKMIQEACSDSLYPVRPQDVLDASVAELRRIREQVLPNQYVVDTEKTYNIEWKMAVENYNLLDIAELSVLGTIFREESRGLHIRPEYPNMKDEWLGVALAKLEEDGSISWRKDTSIYDKIDWINDDMKWEHL